MPATGQEAVSLAQLKTLLESGIEPPTYKPGDRVNLRGMILPSFITGSLQRLYFSIVLPRNIDASVAGFSFDNLSLTGRTSTGYIEDLSTSSSTLPDGTTTKINTSFGAETNIMYGYFLHPANWSGVTNNTVAALYINSGYLVFN